MESLEIYDLNNNLLKIEYIDSFYKEITSEFLATGKISKKVKLVRLFLLDPDGSIFIQKRSNNMHQNAGLYDKTLGGHVKANSSFDQTLKEEAMEELGIKIELVSEGAFYQSVKKTDLKKKAIIRKLDLDKNFKSKRISRTSNLIQPTISQFYLGYYNGSFRFIDKEVSEIKKISLQELEEQLNYYPENFTEDLKYMVKKYEKLLMPIKL